MAEFSCMRALSFTRLDNYTGYETLYDFLKLSLLWVPYYSLQKD